MDGAILITTNSPPPGTGTISHIASGGGWSTRITLLNLGSTSLDVQLRFWTDSGADLVLPLIFPQVNSGSVFTGSSVQRTLGAGGVLVIETQESLGTATTVGWAELASTGEVTGFAIFRQRTPEGQLSEGTVPLADASSTRFVIHSDNVGGFRSGIAIANPKATPATLTVITRDEAGNQLSNDTLTLPARGHTSFFTNDRYSFLTNRRGTIEFQNREGGGVSGIGLRFSPSRSFTSIPALFD
jgi:hypothetical protein